MIAMVLNELGEMKSNPNLLNLEKVPEPAPGEGEVLIRVSACGVCHTELDEIEGRTPPPELPVILGHQVVGVVEEIGKQSSYDSNRFGTTEVITTNTIRVGQRELYL